MRTMAEGTATAGDKQILLLSRSISGCCGTRLMTAARTETGIDVLSGKSPCGRNGRGWQISITKQTKPRYQEALIVKQGLKTRLLTKIFTLV